MPNAMPKGGKSLNCEKVYVEVLALTKADGSIEPKQLTWEDGTVYTIENPSEGTPAVASNAGGQGDRYTVWINSRPTYIFYEHNPIPYTNKPGKWFVEKKLRRQ